MSDDQFLVDILPPPQQQSIPIRNAKIVKLNKGHLHTFEVGDVRVIRFTNDLGQTHLDDDAPAMIHYNKHGATVFYYKNGLLSRNTKDGFGRLQPAIIYNNNRYAYYIDGREVGDIFIPDSLILQYPLYNPSDFVNVNKRGLINHEPFEGVNSSDIFVWPFGNENNAYFFHKMEIIIWWCKSPHHTHPATREVLSESMKARMMIFMDDIKFFG